MDRCRTCRKLEALGVCTHLLHFAEWMLMSCHPGQPVESHSQWKHICTWAISFLMKSICAWATLQAVLQSIGVLTPSSSQVVSPDALQTSRSLSSMPLSLSLFCSTSEMKSIIPVLWIPFKSTHFDTLLQSLKCVCQSVFEFENVHGASILTHSVKK